MHGTRLTKVPDRSEPRHHGRAGQAHAFCPVPVTLGYFEADGERNPRYFPGAGRNFVYCGDFVYLYDEFIFARNARDAGFANQGR
jgi:hypothetical protein